MELLKENDPIHLSDVVKRWKEPDGETKNAYGIHKTKRCVKFPQLYKNQQGQYLGIIHPGTEEKIEAPWSAYLLALMEYSYKNCESYTNMVSGKTFDPPLDGPDGFPPPEDLKELVKTSWAGRDFHFPTLSVNLDDEYSLRKSEDPFTACYIKALQEGIHIKFWDNYIGDIYPDRKEAKLAEVHLKLKELPEILQDDGWKMDESTSIPHRGIRDYNRVVVFKNELTNTQLTLFLRYLRLDKCPGWTGITYRSFEKEDGALGYRFRTTMDSSG